MVCEPEAATQGVLVVLGLEQAAVLQDRHHQPGEGREADLRGQGTGISGADRARTITALADAASVAADFSRPGHVIPMQAGAGTRPGIAEAAVALARWSGLPPCAAFSTIVSIEDPLRTASGAALARFADEHDLPLLSTGDVAG